MADGKNILIEVNNLKKYFPVKTGFMKMNYVKAVDDVSFYIEKGETLGLVGESGCGKTTLGRTILRLHEPTEGKIIYKGEDITHVDMLPYRRKMQIIFQDPYASLDPRMTVGDIIGEALDIHKMYGSKTERRDKINALLDIVGLNTEHANRFAMSSQAASARESASPGRWPWIPSLSCATSPFPPWTFPFRLRW